MISAQPRDYSGRKCKRDETETQAANDETYLILALLWWGARLSVSVFRFLFLFFFFLMVGENLSCGDVAFKVLSREIEIII